MDESEVLTLLTARGGSKGIPRKNLQLLGGYPLVAWPLRAVRDCGFDLTAVCSTDDREIAAAALEHGAVVDQLRPEQLSGDSVMVVEVLRYEIAQARRRGEQPRHLCLLQPTSPFVAGSDIDAALTMARDGEFDVVCTARSVEADHPSAMFTVGEGGQVKWSIADRDIRSRRRQDGPNVLVRAGLVYVFSVEHLLRCGDDYFSGTTGALEVPPARAVSIDSPVDFKWCQFLLDEGLVEVPSPGG